MQFHTNIFIPFAVFPVVEESKQSVSSSGTASVLRSASDPAIGGGAEMWELSLAAASVSKDKRVKDVKNSSLKHHASKKRQTKAETTVAAVTEGQCVPYIIRPIKFTNFSVKVSL